MATKKYDRTRVHDKFMKTIILRLDFAGVTNGDNLTRLFDKRFPKAFISRNEVYNKELNVSFREEDLKEISESLSLPISVIKRDKVVRYQSLKNAVCHVTFDISQYYLCMTITCDNNYDGLDSYLEVFKGAITVFKDKEDYFQPKRLGIRKIRVQPFSSINEFSSIFEPYAFNINPLLKKNNWSVLKSDMVDCVVDLENHLQYNINRKISVGENVHGEKQIISVLDIDAYCKEDSVLGGDLNSFIHKANLKEFDIYTAYMTEAYLDEITK